MIARGFRRLSVLAALTGLAVLIVLGFGPEGVLPTASMERWAWLLAVFVGLPAVGMLLLGWVVAGFRNSN